MNRRRVFPKQVFHVLIANKIFHVTIVLLNHFQDQFVAPEIRQTRRHCSIQRWRQDFDKKVCIWRGAQQRGWQTNFPRKLDKRGVNKLLKMLRDPGTVDRRPGSGKNTRMEGTVQTVNESRGQAVSTTNFLSESCPRCWKQCWLLTNTTVRGDKNAVCLYFPYLLNIYRKFDF